MRLQPTRTIEEIERYRARLAGRQVAVIGAGRSGMACLRVLARAGARVTLADLKPREALGAAGDEAGSLGATIVDRFEALGQLDAPDLIVSSPGVRSDHPALTAAAAAGIEAVGTLELSYRLCPSPVVAISGTNGKGTTCRLLSDMLERASIPHILAGNIGRPLADELERATPETVAVVEVSSFQLETTAAFRPRVSALLSLAPDHLDRHRDFAAYAAAKARLFENQRPEDFTVVNLEDERARRLAEPALATKLCVSLAGEPVDATVRGGVLVLRAWGRSEAICAAADFPLPGRHHLRNVLVAATCARLLGAPAGGIAEAVRGYEPPAHHMETVGEVRGVRFINDSKASNPSSAAADLEAMEQPFVAIVGGKDKGADFSALARLLSERPRAVVLIGESADRIAGSALNGAAFERAATLQEAVRRGMELARPGDAVIMAPACSSFDMFDDYEQRGEVFREAVRALSEEWQQ